ncbi:protein Wiz isoform X1 [Brienomyrus brachyistius]|uniref:protein Wiz isoform X1 n=1 Tax=Brienomyrus brachyistius TaxID=42636 RepID=UPI0020B24AA7|nr:protein Wiz isoform X1 [Brienomyrus brachyistius]
MAASTSPQSQTIAEKPSGCSGRVSDTLQLFNGEEEDWMPVLGNMSTSPECKSDFPLAQEINRVESPAHRDKEDTKANGFLQCEVCSALFETRRGLSSHARLHLRQLGVEVSESSGAPIDLLYRLMREKALDGHVPLAIAARLPTKKHRNRAPAARKRSSPGLQCDVVNPVEKVAPSPHLISTKSASSGSSSLSASARSRSVSPLLNRTPGSPPLRSPERKPSSGSPSSPASRGSPKPLWAPQETDAPLNLALEADPSKDIVCELCGAWFETRKGLSSHARAHLRHLGVRDADARGPPINALSRIIHSEDFQRRLAALDPEEAAELCLAPPSVSSPAAKRTMGSCSAPGGRDSPMSPVRPPASKRPKSSLGSQCFRPGSGEQAASPHSESSKVVCCEFCGEYFENRKGLSSHARSHLRQMGVTEWSVNGSPIDTLMEEVARRGLRCALQSPRTLKSPPASPAPPSLSPLASPASPGPPKCSPLIPTSSHGRLPTARKACRPKPEPVEVPVSEAPGTAGGHNPQPKAHSSARCWPATEAAQSPRMVRSPELEPARDVCCKFCGEVFENRKGLSSHARSHLRQMGITEWSVNGSPIDTLMDEIQRRGLPCRQRVKEEPPSNWEESGCQSPQRHQQKPVIGLPKLSLSGKGGGTPGKRPFPSGAHAEGRLTPHSKAFLPPPQDSVFKDKSSMDKQASGHLGIDASCELCGFCFENRKALASHARAHLRQFGVTKWTINGSPIETLRAWMHSEPRRVVEMQRRCSSLGGWPQPRKKSGSFHLLTGPDRSPGRVQKFVSPGASSGKRAGREVIKGLAGSSRPVEGKCLSPGSKIPVRRADSLPHSQGAHSEVNVRSPRGFERRPPKHLPTSDARAREKGPSQSARSNPVPSLVPKPPSSPLVKVVGDVYSLKCRFCELEFRGPLSVQEDWVRHLQRHILGLGLNKPSPPAPPPPPPAEPPRPPSTAPAVDASVPAPPFTPAPSAAVPISAQAV